MKGVLVVMCLSSLWCSTLLAEQEQPESMWRWGRAWGSAQGTSVFAASGLQLIAMKVRGAGAVQCRVPSTPSPLCCGQPRYPFAACHSAG